MNTCCCPFACFPISVSQLQSVRSTDAAPSVTLHYWQRRPLELNRTISRLHSQINIPRYSIRLAARTNVFTRIRHNLRNLSKNQKLQAFESIPQPSAGKTTFNVRVMFDNRFRRLGLMDSVRYASPLDLETPAAAVASFFFSYPYLHASRRLFLYFMEGLWIMAQIHFW